MGSHGVASPSLVLLAPMPRRPIALVARRHHHHHSRSRSSRTVSSNTLDASAPSPDSAKEPSQRATSPLATSSVTNANCSVVRLVGHPYTRTKTPSNVNLHPTAASPTAAALASVAGWPLGLGVLPVSPPPRSRAGSRDDGAPRPLSRLSSREGATLPLSSALPTAEAPALGSISILERGTHGHVQAVCDTVQMDEAMPASPEVPSAAAPVPSVMDVERTPTKGSGRSRQSMRHPAPAPQDGASQPDDDQEPRSTPTIGTFSPRPDIHSLTLSPVSPTQQRIKASASASAQLPLSLSSPPPPAPLSAPATATATDAKQPDVAIASASLAPSPCLSESRSRSPSASPSPCPSPAFHALLDSDPPKPADADKQEPRKVGLPLPPLPRSPIPRKMTRNPFERYLDLHAARNTTIHTTLQARLAIAMGHSGCGEQGQLVTDAMELAAEQDGTAPEASSLPTRHMPAHANVDTPQSVDSSSMDLED